ncbi:MAG TPA: hypothetical protein VED59_02720 [Acidimicrobiales bacterium]|nr:hypothetical protein [Acidimicrobiales bacterium]
MPGTADEVPIPSLLRASQGAYAHAIAHALVEAGCPPLPRGGVLVVSALANRNLQPGVVIGQIARGERQQQLLDDLSGLGLVRLVAGAWEATELGRRAGGAIASAIGGIDVLLTEHLGVDGVTSLRRGLVALCDIRDAHEPRH